MAPRFLAVATLAVLLLSSAMAARPVVGEEEEALVEAVGSPATEISATAAETATAAANDADLAALAKAVGSPSGEFTTQDLGISESALTDMTDALSSLYVAFPVVTGTPAPEGSDVQKAADGTDAIMASLANATVQAYSELSNYASLFEESDDSIEKQVASVRATPKEITGAVRPSNPYTSVEDDDETKATWQSPNNVTAASRAAGTEKPVSAAEAGINQKTLDDLIAAVNGLTSVAPQSALWSPLVVAARTAGLEDPTPAEPKPLETNVKVVPASGDVEARPWVAEKRSQDGDSAEAPSGILGLGLLGGGARRTPGQLFARLALGN